MTTSTLLPISIQKTMDQEQIEGLSPEEYSQFLADGQFCSTSYHIAPHSVVNYTYESEIHSRITWV